MPVVEVKTWEGRDEVTKGKMIKGITDVLTSLDTFQRCYRHHYEVSTKEFGVRLKNLGIKS